MPSSCVYLSVCLSVCLLHSANILQSLLSGLNSWSQPSLNSRPLSTVVHIEAQLGTVGCAAQLFINYDRASQMRNGRRSKRRCRLCEIWMIYRVWSVTVRTHGCATLYHRIRPIANASYHSFSAACDVCRLLPTLAGDDARGCRDHVTVCVFARACAYLCVRAPKETWLELPTPNLVTIQTVHGSHSVWGQKGHSSR